MENQPFIRSALRFGLLTGGVIVVWDLILYITGLHTNQALGYLSLILLVGGMFLANRDYLTINRGNMSFGTGFKIGFVVASIAGALSSVFVAVYMSINPHLIEESLEVARLEMEKNPQMTPEVIDQAMEMTAKFMTPPAIAGIGFLSLVFLGAILALVVAAIMKKDSGNAGVEEIGG
jgi:hypothetical protein